MEDGGPSVTARRVAAHRLGIAASQLVLWTAIGLIFAPLADRLLAPGPARAELRQARETAGL
jgi:hypothetical protein